jgi:hypothetical protein
MDDVTTKSIRQPRDRLTGQPQERQHSAAVGGARDRLPPARGAIYFFARTIVTRRAEKGSRSASRSLSEARGAIERDRPRKAGVAIGLPLLSYFAGLLLRRFLRRALTPSIAICRRLAFESFSALALPPMLANIRAASFSFIAARAYGLFG